MTGSSFTVLLGCKSEWHESQNATSIFNQLFNSLSVIGSIRKLHWLLEMDLKFGIIYFLRQSIFPQQYTKNWKSVVLPLETWILRVPGVIWKSCYQCHKQLCRWQVEYTRIKPRFYLITIWSLKNREKHFKLYSMEISIALRSSIPVVYSVSYFQTPRRELKIRRLAEYFWRNSRFWITNDALSRVFEISSQSKQKLESKRRTKIVKIFVNFKTSFTFVILFVLTWWIYNEFEKYIIPNFKIHFQSLL